MKSNQLSSNHLNKEVKMRVILDFAFVLNTFAKKALALVKIVKDFFYILYMLAKRLLLLIDAYATLFIINLGGQFIQLEYIFKKLDGFSVFICMFGFRISFGLLILLIYDLIKRDLFELEIKNSETRKKLREQNSFLKKINNKVPWLKKLFERLKNYIINTGWYKKIVKKVWLQNFISYCKKAVWIKKIGNLIIFISFNLGIDPSVDVIRDRPGENKYNGIVNLVILRNYIVGSLLCTIALYISLSSLHEIGIF